MLDHTAKNQQFCDILAWWIKCQELTKCNPLFVPPEFLRLSQSVSECEMWSHKVKATSRNSYCQTWPDVISRRGFSLEKTLWCVTEHSLPNLLDYRVFFRTTYLVHSLLVTWFVFPTSDRFTIVKQFNSHGEV